MKNFYIKISVPIIFLLILYSCSTEKNTSASRFYHNTVGHFNIYFNGIESFKEADQKVEALPENYDILLPVYKAENENVPKLISAETDRAIQKSVKMIKLHSITAKPERKTDSKGKNAYTLTQKEKDFYGKPEYNKFVDDAYLLIGISHYYRHDFHIGMKSLQLILNKFRNEPVKYDAIYWIARSYASLADYDDALSYLKLLNENPKKNKKLQYDAKLLYADIYIKQKNYDKAALMLDSVIELTKNKKQRSRYVFMSAQLNSLNGNNSKAMQLYENVIKMNPPYEMSFNAKIKMAEAYNSESKNSEQLKKTLLKMLKDDKNLEYNDQIYYALALIEYTDQNFTQAEHYYKLSVKKSTTNVNQKALSYLALADIYFNKKKYLQAGNFYDSTMAFLDKKYKNYDEVSKKAANLARLTDNLKIITVEDSLQRIAKMDSVKRNQYIAAIILKIKSDEAAEKNAGNIGYDPFSQGDYNSQTQNASGSWYFYNPQTLSIGKSEFTKIWGNRKLEDNWRRKNKATINFTDENEISQKTDSSGRISDKKNPKYYLQDLPLTDSLLAASDKKIKNALFSAGNVYEIDMNDYSAAVSSFETLLQRYPNSELTVEAYFKIYLICYNNLNDKQKAETYRQKILSQFPNSKYAKILINPNYLQNLNETQNAINSMYQKSYTLYKEKKYYEVISSVDIAVSKFPDNVLNAKFLYLKAQSLGNIGQTSEMAKLLSEITKKYPDDETAIISKQTLEIIQSGKYNPAYYQYNPDEAHFFVIISSPEPKVVDNLNFKVSSYYLEKFPEKEFTAQNINFENNKNLYAVKKFGNKTQAQKMLSGIFENKVLTETETSSVNIFIISESNFERLQKLQILQKYLDFYSLYY